MEAPRQCPVSVWWDIENCGVPSGVEPGAIAGNIRCALAGKGIFGSLSISAYCDTHTLPLTVRKGLSASHVSLQDVPRGGKDSSDKAILVDMLLWALQHPPPAHMLLISNDQGFSKALHALRHLQYRVSISCLPSRDSVASLLRGAANDEWEWPQMARGTCVALQLMPSVSIVTKEEAWEVPPLEIVSTTRGIVLKQQVPDIKNSSKPTNGLDKKPNDVKNAPKPANGPEKKLNDVKNSSKLANVPDKHLNAVKNSKPANGPGKKPIDVKNSPKPAKEPDKKVVPVEAPSKPAPKMVEPRELTKVPVVQFKDFSESVPKPGTSVVDKVAAVLSEIPGKLSPKLVASIMSTSLAAQSQSAKGLIVPEKETLSVGVLESKGCKGSILKDNAGDGADCGQGPSSSKRKNDKSFLLHNLAVEVNSAHRILLPSVVVGNSGIRTGKNNLNLKREVALQEQIPNENSIYNLKSVITDTGLHRLHRPGPFVSPTPLQARFRNQQFRAFPMRGGLGRIQSFCRLLNYAVQLGLYGRRQ